MGFLVGLAEDAAEIQTDKAWTTEGAVVVAPRAGIELGISEEEHRTIPICCTLGGCNRSSIRFGDAPDACVAVASH